MAFKGNNFGRHPRDGHAADDFYDDGIATPTELAAIRTTLPRALRLNFYNPVQLPPQKKNAARQRAHNPKAQKSRRQGQNKIRPRMGTKTQLLHLVRAKRDLLRRHRTRNKIIAITVLLIGLCLGGLTFSIFGAQLEASVRSVWGLAMSKASANLHSIQKNSDGNANQKSLEGSKPKSKKPKTRKTSAKKRHNATSASAPQKISESRIEKRRLDRRRNLN